MHAEGRVVCPYEEHAQVTALGMVSVLVAVCGLCYWSHPRVSSVCALADHGNSAVLQVTGHSQLQVACTAARTDPRMKTT